MADHIRVYVFFDGGHIRDGLHKIGVPWSQVDLSQVAKVALKWVGSSWRELPMKVSRVYIYDAVPDDADPSQHDVETWLTRNGQQRDAHVRRGHLAGDRRGGQRIRQKAVDVQLAVDALMLASNGVFDMALLVTGDADFVPVAEAVRDKGPLVAVCSFGSSLSDALREVADRVGYLPDDPAAWQGWELPPSG